MRSKRRVGYPNISQLSTGRPYSNFNPRHLKKHHQKRFKVQIYVDTLPLSMSLRHSHVTNIDFFLLNNLFIVPLGPK